MASKPETKIVKKILRLLKSEFPGFYFKTHGGPYQRIGLPDILGIHRGRFIGVEVKCPGKEDTLTKLQAETLKKIQFYGGVGFMSTSPEHTKEQLKEEMKSWPIPSSICSRTSTRRKKPSMQNATKSTETASPGPTRSVVRLQF